MEKLYVAVRSEPKDGKVFYHMEIVNGMTLSDATAVLVGGLTLAIKGIENSEEQYKTFKEIVTFIESELFNDKSFKDLYVGVK
jgi:hypothetical protein